MFHLLLVISIHQKRYSCLVITTECKKKTVVMRHLTTIEMMMSREGDKLLRVILKDFVQEISNHHLTHFVAAQMSHTMLRNMVLPRIQ